MIGQTIGQYEIRDTLGAGGMGIVYRATDLTLGRDAALKFLASHLSESQEFRERFLREARSISALNHPNIATIYEAGEARDGELFLAFEYLSGGTLRSTLTKLRSEGRRMPISDVLEFGAALAEGLSHAHRNGILHRDIKPANIMFTADGRLKITDFGLSKYLDQRDASVGDKRVGTVPYMSPEQARGVSLDSRSDIFSAGSVLYEMVTGERAFTGPDEASILRRILNAETSRATIARPDIPPGLQSILDRALAKKPEQRYNSAADMAADLRVLQREVEAPTATIGTTRNLISARPQSRVTRRHVLLASGGAAALAGAAVVWRTHPWSSLPSEKQVAILPFQNLDKSEESQAFCDGLADTLSNSLSQLENPQGALLVIPASEVRRLAAPSPMEAWKAFNANLAIEGTVHREGGLIRVITNLVDAKSGRQIDSRELKRPLSELAGLQDGIVRHVCALLQLPISAAAQSKMNAGTTSNGSAYDLYLQGQGLLDRYDRAGNIDKALDLMQRAVRQDGRYALAYAGLSEANWRKHQTVGAMSDVQYLERAQEAGLRAIQLDDRLAAGHINLARTYAQMGQTGKAIEEFTKATQMDPVSATAYRELAKAYASQGKMRLAEANYQTAVRLRPRDWLTYQAWGMLYYKAGDYRKAEPMFAEVVRLTPDNYIGYRNLAGLHSLLEQYDKAENEYRKAIQLRPDSASSYSGLADILYFQGRYRDAIPSFEKAFSLSKEDSPPVAGDLADAYSQVPEYAAKAAQLYAEAIERANRALARNGKDFDTLGSRAEYHAKLGHRAEALKDAQGAYAGAPQDSQVVVKVALARELAGDRKGALAALTQWRKSTPGATLGTDFAKDPFLSKLRQDPIAQSLKLVK